jgi:hypothetical protein
MPNTIDSNLDAWLESIRYMKRYQRLFITGAPKSGTTWLQKLLNGHPHIVANGESRFAWSLAPKLQQAIAAFNDDHMKFQGNQHALVNDAEFVLVCRAIADNIFLRYLASSGKPIDAVKVIADKTPQHVLSAGLLRALYPTCQFINIVRDPRDAATSALFHLAKGDPRTKEAYIESNIAQTWRLSVGAAIAAEKQLGPNVFLNIRYEDLHANESSALRHCLDFLKLDSSNAMIAQCSDAGNFEKLSGGRQRGQKDPNSFFRSGTVGDWKNHIDPALLRKVCASIEPFMKHFGYTMEPLVETSVYVAPKPGTVAA